MPASVVVSREVALRGFYFWCDDAGVARSFDFPDVRRVDDKLLETMEQFLRERGRAGRASIGLAAASMIGVRVCC